MKLEDLKVGLIQLGYGTSPSGYFLRNGALPFTGDIDLDSNSIDNARLNDPHVGSGIFFDPEVIGGTFDSPALTSPTLTDAILTDPDVSSGSFSNGIFTSIGLTSPIIGDFSYASHSHEGTFSGGSIRHGALNELTTTDDHTQYVKLDGRAGGQTVSGGSTGGNNLILQSTSASGKGLVKIGTSFTYNEANNRVGIGTTNPQFGVHVVSTRFHINTSTNAFPLEISRTGEDAIQLLKIGVDDSVAQFYHIQDESAASYRFRCVSLDTANGSVNASDRSMYLDSDSTSMRLGVGAQTASAHHIIMASRPCTTVNHHAYIRCETTGSTHGETGIEIKAGSNGGSSIWYHSHSTDTPSMLRLWVNSSDRMRIDSSGNVGLGTNRTPVARLDVGTDHSAYWAAFFFNDGNNADRLGIAIACGEDTPTSATSATFIDFLEGDGAATGAIIANSTGVVSLSSSDIRRKTNIAPTQVIGLDVINRIQLIEFSKIKRNEAGEVSFIGPLAPIGFNAQNCQEVFPDVVAPLRDGSLAVGAGGFIPILIKAVQEQHNLIVQLQAELLETKGRLDKLEKR